MKKSNHEVMEVEAEEMLPEVPLEKVIETALIKANVTDQVIAALKEKFGGMKLKRIDDKESYLEIKEARKSVRKVGILTENLCKEGRDRAVKEQRLWLSKQNEILDKIAEVQDPLDAEIKKFDDEKDRKDKEEAERKEAIYINRQSTLLMFGALYNNGSFDLGEISYEVSLLKDSDDETWEGIILPKYRRVYEEKEAARVQEEEKRKEELAKHKKDQEEFEAQQAAFKLQQEEFAKQQKALQDQKDEVERQQRLEQQRKFEEADKKIKDTIAGRIKQLWSLGLKYSIDYDSYVFEDVAISRVVEIEGMDNEKWDELILKVTPTIERNKKEIEEKRLAQLEKEKQATIELAAQQEREKIREEQRQTELKKQQEEQRKAEELAKDGDKAQWANFLLEVSKLIVPTARSGQYRTKTSIAREKIAEILSL